MTCFHVSTSALLHIPWAVSRVHMDGLKREHVGGGYWLDLSPRIAAPLWMRDNSGSSASLFHSQTRIGCAEVGEDGQLPLPDIDCPIGQGVETGVPFPVGRNPLRFDSPYALSAKPRILTACLASHGYLSGACCSQMWSVPHRLAPTAHEIPVYPKESYLIPSMRFTAHRPCSIGARFGLLQLFSNRDNDIT